MFISDLRSHPIRGMSECVGMLLAVGTSLLVASTTPTPPMVVVYMGWLSSGLLLGGGALHRKSLGLTITYGLYILIDVIGFIRTIFYG